MTLNEIEKDIAGIHFKLRQLSWHRRLTLMDDGFTNRQFIRLTVIEPTDLTFFDDWSKEQGQELLKYVLEVNKNQDKKSDTEDFPSSSQTPSTKKT